MLPADPPLIIKWRAAVGWWDAPDLAVRYRWEEAEEFDEWEDAAHWLRCKVEDQTVHAYDYLPMLPDKDFSFRTVVGQAFAISEVVK